ncbi:MAG: family 20 glycosylhydrolase [Bacteroidales bacterium]|nr:family 20 glycosylhydrolase [Bacteroidales bacterium]
MKHHTKFFFAFFLSVCFCFIYGQLPIIPYPAEIEMSEGHFLLGKETILVAEQEEVLSMADERAKQWETKLGFRLKIGTKLSEMPNSSVVLVINKTINEGIGSEGYQLIINPERAELSANTTAGILYGLETIGQLLDADKEKRLPCGVIIDYPRFSYRGMHLDVSRHFMPIEFIYKVIDFLVMHKMNIFHWHLVDDQGWRLEINKYPKLTGVGAWRVPMPEKHWDDRPLTTDRTHATYGGFYTQDDVKQVVAYAEARNITIIPEIEMPAHVMSALAAYPEFSCTGENLGVPPGGVWPITHIYCAGKEETFEFLENVLTEVMELFPSTYIHIGGDEADKTNWKSCPTCQERMKVEGLENEEELQSYFIHRIERFLNAHGRRIIGWDEILEGGLAPNATVMSWRGEAGGIEAAGMGHQVVMTPGSHCYFDHYQGDPSLEPVAHGGYTTLKKVYLYEPVRAELTTEEGELVLGAQANVWSEFISTPQHAEYMIFPRLSALSEVLWSPKATRDWEDFSERMEIQYKRYADADLNYSLSAFQVKASPRLDPENRRLLVELDSEVFQPEIRFTTDGSAPDIHSTLYRSPVSIAGTARLKAAVFKDEKASGQVMSAHYEIHKAFASQIQIQHPNSPRYNGGGQYGLVDGISGTISFADGKWKGFSGDDLIAVIDLGESMTINTIGLDALQSIASWIFLPLWVSFEVSANGQNFRLLETVQTPYDSESNGKYIQDYGTSEAATDVRYLRITAKNFGVCPPGHSGEGKPAWLFVSEIVVR